MVLRSPSSDFNLAPPDHSTIVSSVSHALDFDGVDFDEPMEVRLEEERPTVKSDAKSIDAAEVATKVEPQAEPHGPVLL